MSKPTLSELQKVLLRSFIYTIFALILFFIFARESVELSFINIVLLFLAIVFIQMFGRRGLLHKRLGEVRDRRSVTPRLISPLKSAAIWELPHPGIIRDVAWSPNGKFLATSCEDEAVRIFKVSGDTTQVASLAYRPGPLFTTVAWSPDSTLVSLAGDVISVSEIRSGKVVRVFDYRKTLPDYTDNLILPSAVDWSPDGQLLANSFHDGSNLLGYSSKILIWDVSKGNLRVILEGHDGGVNRVAWSPDNRLLASVGIDQTIRIWDAETGHEHVRFPPHPDEVWGVSWSPNGERVATAAHDGVVRIWNLNHLNGPEREIREKEAGGLWSVAWSPEGNVIAFGGDSGKLKLLSLTDETHKGEISGHQAAVGAISWAKEINLLASGDDNGMVRIWDVENLEELLF